MTPDEKQAKLTALLRQHSPLAAAFSGGVDSNFLLRAAVEALSAENVLGVVGDSPSLPRAELEAAERLAAARGIPHVADGSKADIWVLRGASDCRRRTSRRWPASPRACRTARRSWPKFWGGSSVRNGSCAAWASTRCASGTTATSRASRSNPPRSSGSPPSPSAAPLRPASGSSARHTALDLAGYRMGNLNPD